MSTARSRLLALMLALSLTACAANSTKPTPPLPPRVDCQQRATDNPPPAPTCGPAQCEGDWVGYVVTLLGGWTQERVLRKAERQCVDALKRQGVIR